MKSQKKIILFQILKNSFLWKAVCGYLLFFFISSLIVFLVEPTITAFGDALWYSFVSATTIGFGDFAATGLIARIMTVIIYFYTVLIIALVTAVFTQFFIEVAKAKRDKSIAVLQNDMENLAELPKERLEEISATIRKFKGK